MAKVDSRLNEWRYQKGIWAKAKAKSEGRAVHRYISVEERRRVQALAEEMRRPETTPARQRRIQQGLVPEESGAGNP